MSVRVPPTMRWHTFKYNFGWPNYAQFLDGWIPRCAMAVPVVGYLVLFNDTIAAHVSFEKLAAGGTSAFGLSSSARLKLIYLGLLFLGLANILYRWKRPWPMRLADNEIDYVDRGLKHFTVADYIRFHGTIRYSDRDSYTTHGKYYDSEWESFMEGATGSKPGGALREGSEKLGHWNEAKSKYEGLLRSILIEMYFREAHHTRRGWLVFCLVLAAIGYGMLAVPSVDLLMKALSVIFAPLLDWVDVHIFRNLSMTILTNL